MAYFAIQVNTGEELQAKEMLLDLLSRSKIEEANDIKAIYTMQKYTTFLNASDDVSDGFLNEEKEHHHKIVKESIGKHIGNLKKQYEGLKHKKDCKSIALKNSLKDKINQLHHEQQTYKTQTTMKSLLPGYVLVEIEADIEYLPEGLYDLINEVPLVNSILSRISLPEQDVEWMFETIEIKESQVEIQFDEVATQQEAEQKEKEAIYYANTAKHPDEEKEYIEKSKQQTESFISKVNNRKKNSEYTIDRLKGFIKNKKETVKMSVSLFREIYPETFKTEVLPALSLRDFINRLDRLLSKNRVALE